MKSENVVYGHYDAEDRLRYIGMGTKLRPFKRDIRSEEWRRVFPSGPDKIVIFRQNLSRREALDLESKMILENISSGFLLNFSPHGKNRCGQKHTEDTKKLMRDSALGRRHSKATREKISRVQIGRKNKQARPVMCLETSNIYRCAGDAAKELGLSDKHIQACCVGRRHRHGGFTWKYHLEEKK